MASASLMKNGRSIAGTSRMRIDDFGSRFLRSALAHLRVSSAAALVGVTISIVGWPMSLASVIFSPLSAVAWNEGIGLFGAAPTQCAMNRAQTAATTSFGVGL